MVVVLIAVLTAVIVLIWFLYRKNVASEVLLSSRQDQCSDLQENPSLCCMCGNVRNRLRETGTKGVSVSDILLPQRRPLGVVRMLQSIVQAANNNPASRGKKDDNLRNTHKEVRDTPKFRGLVPCSSHATATSTKITATPTSAKLSASSDVPMGASSMSVVSTNVNDTGEKSSTRKLILEILMSPSGMSEEQAGKFCLKLEANTTLEALASLTGSDCKDVNKFCGEVMNATPCLVTSTTVGSVAAGSENGNQDKDTVCHTSTMLCGLRVVEVDPALENASDGERGVKELGNITNLQTMPMPYSHSSSQKGPICPCLKEKVPGMQPAGLDVKSGKAADGISLSCNEWSAISTSKTGQLNCTHTAAMSDGLASLQISLLESAGKNKPSRDCTSNASPALAALTVDAMGSKASGMGQASFELGSASYDPCRKAPSSKLRPTSQDAMEEGVDEFGHRGGLTDGLIQKEDFGSGSDMRKKDKKKKKNRSKKQKTKTPATCPTVTLVGICQDLDTQNELSDLVKNALEVELGCTCGTPKGGLHYGSCPYPFISSGSMVQRKIKEQYDELVRANANKTLTLAQVGRFTTCLVDAKVALQNKSENIQRRFTIAKSLLAKADKSSFDRICGQIYGLEVEQKRLEEDTVVYNRLQEQLKLSPAYQKMLEYGRTHFELQPNTGQLVEKPPVEDEISFEELLAKEKKDSFWKKYGTSRSSVQVV